MDIRKQFEATKSKYRFRVHEANTDEIKAPIVKIPIQNDIGLIFSAILLNLWANKSYIFKPSLQTNTNCQLTAWENSGGFWPLLLTG
jgi:hypothetical protein